MAPLVSVIVPVWNGAGLLPRCLDSLLAQTHRRLEIIVVDDGSSDGSAAVALAYHARHPDLVHVVRQQHRGIGPARNAGLSVARGEFVSCVDADDWVDPEFCAHLVAVAQDSGADAVISGLWFHAGPLRAPFPFLPRQHVITGEEAARRCLNPSRMPSFAWNKLYRRSLFADEPPFPSIWYEDLATIPRVLVRARRVALTRGAHYHYCLRGDSVTGAFGLRNVFSVVAAMDLLRHQLLASGRWPGWRRSYLGLVRQMQLLVGLQIVFSHGSIPPTARVPVLRRFRHRLRALEQTPDGRHQLEVVTLADAGAKGTCAPRPVSQTVAVRRVGTGD